MILVHFIYYIVKASGNGGILSPEKCPDINESPRIGHAVKHHEECFLPRDDRVIVEDDAIWKSERSVQVI